jgi:hypothetical protein
MLKQARLNVNEQNHSMKLSILYIYIFNGREDFTLDIVIRVTPRQWVGVNDRSALHYSIFEIGFGTPYGLHQN